MTLTDRDIRLVKDIALSHVLSRDQIIRLGYFSSVSRCNRRLATLVEAKLVQVHATPFHAQRLYIPGSRTHQVVGERIAVLLTGRTGTPRYLQHALAVTDARIALSTSELAKWKFEQQVWDDFTWGGLRHEVRPDGLIIGGERPTFVEVDLGHVAPSKFAKKLRSYQAYLDSGAFLVSYGSSEFTLLTVTTTRSRAKRFERLVPKSFPAQYVTFSELGIVPQGGWS